MPLLTAELRTGCSKIAVLDDLEIPHRLVDGHDVAQLLAIHALRATWITSAANGCQQRHGAGWMFLPLSFMKAGKPRPILAGRARIDLSGMSVSIVFECAILPLRLHSGVACRS